MLALHKLEGQWIGENMHYVWKRTGAQLLQIPHRQKELMVTLPFCYLKKSADAVQSCLLYPINQLASPALAYESSRK